MATPRRRCASATIMLDCRGLTSHDPFFHAARHHRLEQFPQKTAFAETAVAVLGKGRMIGDVAVEPQPTKPAIGQIEVDNRV